MQIGVYNKKNILFIEKVIIFYGKVLKSPRNLKTYDLMLDGDTIMIDLE